MRSVASCFCNNGVTCSDVKEKKRFLSFLSPKANWIHPQVDIVLGELPSLVFLCIFTLGRNEARELGGIARS